jgi:hypothetical protein
MGTPTCNPSYSGGQGREDRSSNLPRQKVSMPVIPAMQEGTGIDPVPVGKHARLYSKNNKSKKS